MDGTLDKLRDITNYHVKTMPNGARLVTHYRPSISVNVSVQFGYGTAYESPENRQAAHFAEHMMFRKGSKVDYRRRNEELEHLSANGVNASTDFEKIALGNHNTFVTLPQNVSRLVHLLGEMVYDDRIEEEFFEAERQIVLREQSPKERPESYAFSRRVDRALWGERHPYTLASEACVDNVKRLSIVDVREVFDYLNGRNVVVSVVGCYDEETLHAVEDVFGTRSLDKSRKEIPKPEKPKSEVLMTCRMHDVSAPYSSLIFRLPENSHPDIPKVQFLNIYLSDSSILQRRLRDELGLCYSAYTSNFSLINGSTFGINATNFLEEDADKVVAAMKHEVEKIKQGDIDRAFIERKKKEAENAAIGYESGAYSADVFANCELFGTRPPYEYCESVASTTAEDMQRIAQEHFVNPVVVIGLPKAA